MFDQPADPPPSAPLTIACDESGSEGENLMQAAHTVFVHASTTVSRDEASSLMAELRGRIPSQAPEFKSEQLLRPQNKGTLEWFLRSDGPLEQKALVHLTEKTFFVVGKVIDLLIEEMTHQAGIDLYAGDQARQMAFTLYRDGERAFGSTRWYRFLESFNNLARSKNRHGVRVSVNEFFESVDDLRLRSKRRSLESIMALLWRARAQAEDLTDEIYAVPALDPLFPALVQSILGWGGAQREIAVVHDEQSALKPGRIEMLRSAFDNPEESLRPYMPGLKLSKLELAKSQDDPRVQIADLLAGAARKISSDELAGVGDPALVPLLTPYVHPHSLWGDEKSWATLSRSD